MTAAITDAASSSPPRPSGRTVAVHSPDGRPVLLAGDRLTSASPEARRVASALAWIGHVDLVLHAADPRRGTHEGAPPQVEVALTLRRVAGGTALEVAGDLDESTVPLVRDAVDIALGAGPPRLYLHLAAVVSCAAAGVDLIMGLHHTLARAGGELVAVAVPAMLRQVLDLTHGAGSLAVQDHLPAPLPLAWPDDRTPAGGWLS